MDINNYSYTHDFDAEKPIKEYKNDDMYAEIYKSRAYSRIYYEFYACSYDGSLEVAENFSDYKTAEKLFDFVVDNYSDTPPVDDTLTDFINTLQERIA